MLRLYTRLSKEISYALRHAPWEYELEMDAEGWVPIEQLLDALHRDGMPSYHGWMHTLS